ncbi:hypothetical protein [Phaeobacter piscinae]|uniref:hypothetical protein n=1 Tax=Phaeobacter piscinae TaxID=1580596 RepID=UPI00131497D7|nr:hypothetical protein [Phaeobacter piscinae]
MEAPPESPDTSLANDATMGSLPTYGGAAGGLRRDRLAVQVPEDSRQPNHDILAMRSEGFAASANKFPKADTQGCSAIGWGLPLHCIRLHPQSLGEAQLRPGLEKAQIALKV